MALDEDIFKMMADMTQPTKAIKEFKESYARMLQDMGRDAKGHVTQNIQYYRAEVDARIKGFKEQSSAHTEMVTKIVSGIKQISAEDRAAAEERAAIRGREIRIARLGRGAAGAAGAMGHYRLGSGLYAASNLMQATGTTVSMGTAAGIGAAGIGALAAGGLLMYGRELNIELAKMSTLLLPASAGTEELSTAMSSAAESAARLAARFNVDVVDVVKAYKEALSSGIEAEDLERFGKVAGTLSKALGEDFGKSVTVLTTFKDTYGATISDLGEFNDVLFNVVDKGRVNASQMLNNFGRMLPIAKAAGIELKDLSAVFATLSRQMTVAQATTSTMRIIEGIVNPSDKAKKAFQALGVQFGQTAFEGRSLVEVMNDITKRTGGSAEMITALFPEVQASRGVTAVSKTLELLNKMPSAMDEVKTASVAAARAQDTIWEALGSKIEQATSKLKIFGSGLANAMNTAFKFYGEGKIKGSSAEEFAFKYLQSKNVDSLSFGMMKGNFWNEQNAFGLNDKTGKYFNENILKGVGATKHSGGYALSKSFRDRYLSWLQEQQDIERDKAEKKNKADAELLDATEKELKLIQEEVSVGSKRLRDKRLSKRITPEQSRNIDDLKESLEDYKSGARAGIENRYMYARSGITDGGKLKAINEARAAELENMQREITKRENAIILLEDQILVQREYKDILKEEASARKEAVAILKQDARLKEETLKADEAKKKANAAREAKEEAADAKWRAEVGLAPKINKGWKGFGGRMAKFGEKSDDDSVYRMTPREIVAKEQKDLEKKLAENDKLKAKEDELTKKILDTRKKMKGGVEEIGSSMISIGENTMTMAATLVESADIISSAVAGILAARNNLLGGGNVTNNANVDVSISGENSIDSAKVAEAVKNGIDRAKRNGTMKSNYQQKSVAPKLSAPSNLQTMQMEE